MKTGVGSAAQPSREHQARIGVLAVGLFCALWGIRWGLPGQGRQSAFAGVAASSPRFIQVLADSWKNLYKNIWLSHKGMAKEEPVTYVQGVAVINSGWSYPPPSLMDSYRSFLLQSEDPDEKKSFIILSQMRPWRLNFEPLYVQYGGAFIYSLGAVLAASSATGTVKLVSGLSYYLQHPEEMARLYLCGRLFMALFQLLTVWLLYELGLALSGWKTGALAAVFFIFCPAVAVHSHILKPHPFAAFWCLVAVAFAIQALERGRLRDYLLCGLAVGMAAGSQFFMACFAIAPILAWLMRRGRLDRLAARREFFAAAQAVLIAAALCVLTNPYLLVASRDFAWELTVYAGHGRASFGQSLSALVRGWRSGVGIVLSLAMMGAALIAVIRRGDKRRFVALTSLIILCVLWMGYTKLWAFSGSPFVLRYYYALIGPFCLLAADWAVTEFPGFLKLAFIAAVLFENGLQSAVYYRNMALDSGPSSTRRMAAAWIDHNVPQGASIGLLNYPEPSHTPPFDYARYRLVVFDQPSSLKPSQYPRYMVLDAEAQKSMRSWLAQRYGLIAAFEPWSFWGFKADDASFYANTGAYVYAEKSP